MTPLARPWPRLLALGDGAWTVEFGNIMDEPTHERVMGMAARLSEERTSHPLMAGVVDVVPTLRSLSVYFDPGTTDGQALGQRLAQLAQEDTRLAARGRAWRLPVCFDEDFAPDLGRLGSTGQLSREQAIDLLLATTLRVYMLGFQPGFPYMGSLPAALSLPRLSSPRQKVPARSVAIAGEMCAVYPWESPGGWNLIGRTPVVLFDLCHAGQAAMLDAGDTVRWYAVDRRTHDDLAADIARGLPRHTFLETARA